VIGIGGIGLNVRFMLRKAVLVASLLALSGCGITYTSPKVRAKDLETDVTVVKLDARSVSEANQLTYSPRNLPSAFFGTAGGGNLIGAGALPRAPDVPTERPKPLVLTAPPAITPEAYKIGIGDVLLLATRGNATTVEQLSGLLAAQNQRQGYTVRDDGAIAIPEVGPVQLLGLTLQEAEDRLFQVLVGNQIDPSFSLEVAEFNSQLVAVGGAVNSAEIVPIGLRPLTLSNALTVAGGVDVRDEEFASIRIYRNGSLYQIPLQSFLERSELRDTILQDGDAVYVDTSYDLDRAFEYYKQQINVIALKASSRGTALQALSTEIGIRRQALDERRSNFKARIDLDAVERDYVYLTGEVKSQSRVALPFGRMATLADVLYDEGGFNNATGDPAEIYVLRANPYRGEGAVIAYHLNARNAANIVLATRLEMRPNDVVFIEEQPITKWGRSLQQLFPILANQAVK